jgi:hypothetical protein
MKIRTTTGSISCSLAEAIVTEPRTDVGFLERCYYRWEGLTDRIRYRTVNDRERPHTLLALEHTCQRFEGGAVREVEVLHTALVVELAGIEDPTLGEDREAPLPDRVELAALAGQDRQDWALRSRTVRKRNATVAARNAGAKARAQRRTILSEELRRVSVECDAVRNLWTRAFEQRADIYSRSRHGFFGATPSSSPGFAPYRQVTGLVDATHGDTSLEAARIAVAGSETAPLLRDRDGIHLLQLPDQVG